MNTNKNMNTVSGYEAILETMETYKEGLRTGNIDLLKKAFHPEAIMYGQWDEFLVEGSIGNLYASVERAGAATNIATHTSILHKTETTAIVRNEVETNATGDDFTEYHSLVMMDDQWKIISKLFHKYTR